MKLLDRFLPKHYRQCVHSFTEESTLRVGTISALGSSMYYVYCKECDAATEIYLTTEEAIAQAEKGMMK